MEFTKMTTRNPNDLIINMILNVSINGIEAKDDKVRQLYLYNRGCYLFHKGTDSKGREKIWEWNNHDHNNDEPYLGLYLNDLIDTLLFLTDISYRQILEIQNFVASKGIEVIETKV